MPLTTGCLNDEFEQINEWNVTHVIANKKLPIQSEFESHNKPRIQSRIVNVFVSFINNKHHLLNFSRGGGGQIFASLWSNPSEIGNIIVCREVSAHCAKSIALSYG